MKTGVRGSQVLEGIVRDIEGTGFAFFRLSSLSLFRFSIGTLLRAGLA